MPGTLTCANLSWPVIADEEDGYRPRGRDQRELTLPELWRFPATATSKPDQGEITSELHARLVLIVTMPLLPLLAAPLALAGGPRRPPATPASPSASSCATRSACCSWSPRSCSRWARW